MTRKRRGRPLTVDEERDKDQATIALVNNILDKKPVCCSPGKVLSSHKNGPIYSLFGTLTAAIFQLFLALKI